MEKVIWICNCGQYVNQSGTCKAWGEWIPLDQIKDHGCPICGSPFSEFTKVEDCISKVQMNIHSREGAGE